MGLWDQEVLPHLVDWGMNNRTLHRERRAALLRAQGRVLEVGFGSGLNLPHYPPGAVKALVAVEPNLRALKLARRRIEAAGFEVQVIGLEGEKIPCADHSFDTVVSTFTLCTIPGVSVALGQLRRVLKPGGRFIFLEHGRAPEAHVHRWQSRAEPVQRALFGGCHLTRDIEGLVSASGFEIHTLERYYSKGPKLMSYFFRGEASRAGEDQSERK